MRSLRTSLRSSAAGVRSSVRLVRGLHPRRALATLPPPDESLKPDEVVNLLDKHIVGQGEAKTAVAIALRDQYRRKKLSPELQREVLPNNILMVGPTGVGKTEVARRLARLASAPFVKCEATKYTEVGIYGADTESMIADLVDAAMTQAEERARAAARPQAKERAVQRLVKAIGWRDESERDSIAQLLRDGKMDDEMVKISMPSSSRGGGSRGGGGGPFGALPMMPGMPRGLQEMLRNMSKGGGGGMPPGGVGVITMDARDFEDGGSGSSGRGGDGGGGGKADAEERVRAGDALPRWEEAEVEEAVSGIDLEAEAISHAEERGIIFVDEIDKLVRREGGLGGGGGGGGGSFVKGEGVQKELLALIEGTHVRTPRGLVSTAHILFICAGAFHMAKPADLLPELQGRLPVRVELKPLTEGDFVRILSDTKFNLLLQQQKLLETEGVTLTFTEDAVREIASLAARVNTSVENIGARRLRTVIAKLMEEVSFTAHHLAGQEVLVDAAYVKAHTADLATDTDVRKYLL